ncbi:MULTISPECIES: hypothetical protein [Enterobacter cloacae complex]|nr:hypothetical protein [Enterobacter asburiae]MCK7247645.1 hypothetical protein [Enterobacter asburiae]
MANKMLSFKVNEKIMGAAAPTLLLITEVIIINATILFGKNILDIMGSP